MMITKPTLDDLIVRSAQETDVWDLAELHRTCWQNAFSGMLTPDYLASLTPEKELEMWQRRFRSKSFRRSLHVADYHGFTVGYLVARPSTRDGEGTNGEKWMEVSEFYVSPSVWRKGVGSRMMDIMKDMILISGFERACLWALASAESSRAFYEANGWSLSETVRGRTTVGEQRVELVRYTFEL